MPKETREKTTTDARKTILPEMCFLLCGWMDDDDMMHPSQSQTASSITKTHSSRFFSEISVGWRGKKEEKTERQAALKCSIGVEFHFPGSPQVPYMISPDPGSFLSDLTINQCCIKTFYFWGQTYKRFYKKRANVFWQTDTHVAWADRHTGKIVVCYFDKWTWRQPLSVCFISIETSQWAFHLCLLPEEPATNSFDP